MVGAVLLCVCAVVACVYVLGCVFFWSCVCFVVYVLLCVCAWCVCLSVCVCVCVCVCNFLEKMLVHAVFSQNMNYLVVHKSKKDVNFVSSCNFVKF